MQGAVVTGRRGSGRLLRRWWGALALALCALMLAGAAEARAAVVGGTVTYGRDASVTPLFGATVTVADPRAGPVATATSGVDGSWSLVVADGVYVVTIEAPGFTSQSFAGVGVSRGATVDATLVATDRVRFALTVTRGGRPASGTVLFDEFRQPLDVDGRLVAYPLAGTQRLLLASEGAFFDSGGFELAGDAEETLALPAVTTLTVRVQDFELTPIAGATVTVPSLAAQVTGESGLFGAGQLSRNVVMGTTDRAGELQVPADVGSSASSLGVVRTPDVPEYEDSSLYVGEVTADEVVTVWLERRTRLTGTLSDPGGPLAGYEVGTRGDRGTVAADGSFDLWVGAHWSYLLITSDDAVGRLWLSADTTFERDRELHLRLPARETRVVRVVDGDGRPVEDAVVNVPAQRADVDLGGGLAGEAEHHDLVATTDGGGEVALSLLPGARPSPWSGRGTVVAPEGSGLPTVEFDLGGALTTVVLADPPPPDVTLSGWLRPHGLPVEGAVLQLGAHSAITASDGSFSFTVAPGTYDLSGDWSAADGAHATLAMPGVELTADRSIMLRWGSRAARVVSVRDEQGRAVEGAQVQLPLYEETSPVTPGATLAMRYPPVLTGPTGDAQFAVLAGVEPGLPGHVQPPIGSQLADASFAPWPAGSADPVVVTLRSTAVAPQIDFEVTPAPVTRGDWWSVSRVAVQVTASDAAGVRALACSVDGVTRTFTQTTTATTRGGTFYVNLEGRHVAACTAVDGSGTAATAERAVNLDLKNPLAPTATADRPADSANGWHRDAVTVAFAANGDPLLADGSAGSGVDPGSLPAEQTYGRSGTHVAAGTVADRSGRTSAAGRLTVKVDADAPTSTLTCPAAPVSRGASATARWADADAHSGLTGTSGGTFALDTTAVGTFAAEHVAADRVGHRAASSCSYTVVHPFVWRGGISAPPTVNAVAPGVATLAVWFSVGGDRGLGILGRDGVAVQPVACGDGTPAGAAVPATLATPLAWEAGTGRYSVGWSVGDDLPAGTCAALRITLDDGVTREALFAR